MKNFGKTKFLILLIYFINFLGYLLEYWLFLTNFGEEKIHMTLLYLP